MAASLAATLAGGAASGPAPAADVRTPLVRQAVAAVLSETPTMPATRQPGGDSLKNGALVGGTVAGIGLGGFVFWLCYMLDETEGKGDCVGAGLLWGGIGFAGGAAIGAGVDALVDRGEPRWPQPARRGLGIRVKF